MEIFSNYGVVKTVDLPCDRTNSHLNRSFAYIDFQKHDDAEKALRHMDGGRLNDLGTFLKCPQIYIKLTGFEDNESGKLPFKY